VANKRSIIKIMNRYLAESCQDTIDSFYGIGTKIKVKNLSYSLSNNLILVEVKIELGEVISEEVMENEMCDLLIRETIEPIYPEQHIKVMISWDV
jgi:hypothetical protein